MTNIKSTYYKINLLDGTETEMTLNFAALYKLRAKNKSLYDRYNELMTKGQIKDELDNITILYTAYVCANIDKEYMNFKDFLEVVPFDRDVIGDIILNLLTPSAKKKDLLKRSEKQQKV